MPNALPLKNFIHFETLGCRLNSADTESLASRFLQQGYALYSSDKAAKNDVQLCVVNTCAVTGKAEQKCRRVIRALLKKFPNSTVLVTGCYAKLNSAEIEKISPRIHCKDFALSDVAISDGAFSHFSADFLFHSRAVLKIQDGCDNACTYCKTTLARGPSRSLDFAQVLERARAIEKSGYTEIVLTGVNICDYRSYDGKNYDGNRLHTKTLSDVIAGILAATKSISLRLSSLHPAFVLRDERFLETIHSERVRPHFHFSVQSGSDAVLQRMGRTYSRADVCAAVKRITHIKRGAFTACDIIAGFPGETDADFAQTLELCQTCGFAHIHAFPFSPRPGTPAFSYKNQIAQKTKLARVKKLTEFAVRSKIDYVRSFAGCTLSAVIEKKRDNEPFLRALTANFIHVIIDYRADCFDGKEAENRNKTEVRVKITEVLENSILSGEEAEAKAVLL